MIASIPNAASVALIRDGQVLLIRRARPPMAGFWTLPGGRREPGEAIADTARREVLEELGLAISALRTLTMVAVGEWTLEVFVAAADDVPPAPSGEIADWRWAGLDDLGGLATTPGLADVLALALRLPPSLA